MLKTIEFIKEHDDWRELLKSPPYCLTINEDDNYAIFKYSQLNSDFNEQICRECRGLVIDKDTLEPVALSFYKFFNVQEEFADKIDWNTASVQEKIDGSKILAWYNKYENKWQISTSSQLDAYKANVSDFGITFGQLFDRAQINFILPKYVTLFEYLDKKYCYTFELVAPESRVVVPYKDTEIYFIGARDVETFEEKDPKDFELHEFMKTPKVFKLNNLKSCLYAVDHFGFDQEGFVVVDKDWHRVKIKSPAYVSAHYLRNNGVNSQARILNIIENNEQSEFLGIFPEYKEYFDDVEKKFNDYKKRIYDGITDIAVKMEINNTILTDTWIRKDFATYINNTYPDISPFLFKFLDVDLRKLFVDTEWNKLSSDQKMKRLGLKYEEE